VNSLPKTVTRQRRGYDLNPGPEIQTDVVSVAADQSFLSFVCSPVLASVGFCFGKSEVYFYVPLCGEGNAIGRVRSFFLLYLKPADLELDVLFVYGSSPQLTRD